MSETRPEPLKAQWPKARLSDIGELLSGQSPPSNSVNRDERGIVYVSGPEQWDGHQVHVSKWTTEPKRMAPDHSLFITVKGAGVGKIFPGIRAAIGRDIYAFVPSQGVSIRFVEHALRYTVHEVLRHAAGDIPGLSRSHILEHEIAFPPYDVQQAVVAEVEKQFSRLDEAVANLRRVRANLKRYETSVLKAAFDAQLAESEASIAAREARIFESGAQLVRRVVEERRLNWGGRRSFRVPDTPRQADLPELPEGWTWSTFEAVADRVTVGHVGSMKNEYVSSGIPFLRSQNVRANRFEPEGLKYITPAFHASLEKSSLSPGDIVVVRSGSVGVSCVIPDGLPTANCSDLVIIKSPRAVHAKFGAYYLNSVVESRIASGRVGVALVHFNTQSVAELPVPIPPLAEQLRIVAEIDRRLSVVREVEAVVDANLKRAQALRQAILAKAFAG